MVRTIATTSLLENERSRARVIERRRKLRKGGYDGKSTLSSYFFAPPNLHT